ncbi:hypothetical protein RFI_32861, partial [Reticulomyxa filosa]
KWFGRSKLQKHLRVTSSTMPSKEMQNEGSDTPFSMYFEYEDKAIGDSKYDVSFDQEITIYLPLGQNIVRLKLMANQIHMVFKFQCYEPLNIFWPNHVDVNTDNIKSVFAKKMKELLILLVVVWFKLAFNTNIKSKPNKNSLNFSIFKTILLTKKSRSIKYSNSKPNFLLKCKLKLQPKKFLLTMSILIEKEYIEDFSNSETLANKKEKAFFKSLLEECFSSLIPLLKVKTTQRPSVRMSQSKHYLKYVQEYLRMAREVTIDKEYLDYLNHYETFYICNMTDNLQYWMIVVEKESFVVCCENGGLPSHSTLSSLQFFKVTHHNMASICLNTAKSMMQCSDIGMHFMESFYGHDFLTEDVLMYSGKLLLNETLLQQQIVKTFRRLKMQQYLEKFLEQFRFFQRKREIFFRDSSTISLIFFLIKKRLIINFFFFLIKKNNNKNFFF